MAFNDIRQKFQKDGFAVVKNFLDDNDVNVLQSECWKIVEEMNPAEHHTVFSTTKQTNNDYFMTSGDKICFFFEKDALSENALHALNPVFKRVTFSDKMKELTKSLGLVDPVVCQSMYIFKQPVIGGEVVPHQDSTFLYTSPTKLIGFWIALQDAVCENGCLWFIPGSHKDGVHGNYRMIKNPDKDSQESGTIFTAPKVTYDDAKFIPVEVKKGDMVIIHGEVVHKSERNLSSHSRHVYTFHIYDQERTEYSDKNWLQPTDANTFTHLYTYA